ncbi:hypothetical protein TW83_09970 [Paracoccus sp. S4493]|uniref:hypothetical protein n=1 Tax=Paracoccus sp. S4493 TaxID=579490 RepID=UPI0005FA4DB7|nr:hypothetical protein [Paracoccus sp. S4493]KJZ31239.1 hypothetical protein TW83_09970 [Paracoccus sp. S4493]
MPDPKRLQLQQTISDLVREIPEFDGRVMRGLSPIDYKKAIFPVATIIESPKESEDDERWPEIKKHSRSRLLKINLDIVCLCEKDPDEVRQSDEAYRLLYKVLGKLAVAKNITNEDGMPRPLGHYLNEFRVGKGSVIAPGKHGDYHLIIIPIAIEFEEQL